MMTVPTSPLERMILTNDWGDVDNLPTTLKIELARRALDSIDVDLSLIGSRFWPTPASDALPTLRHSYDDNPADTSRLDYSSSPASVDPGPATAPISVPPPPSE